MASNTLNIMWKKHRHRVGLGYFLSGLAVGLLCSYLLPHSKSQQQNSLSSSSLSSTSIRSSSKSLCPQQQSCPQQENGWNLVHVFYGDTNHIKYNSAISNDYFDQVQWYSQARQDEVVAALLRNKRNGYFIDLASNDPVKISNTYALETTFGWTGLCLEPNPAYWAGLAYRKCHVVGAVVGSERMQEIQFRFPNRVGPQGGIVGRDFDNKESSKFDEDKPRYTVTLLEIFERFQTPTVIDYMSLDVGESSRYWRSVCVRACALADLFLVWQGIW
jgi:hypothetical protein